MADLTTEEIAELRRLLNERRKVGPWYGNLRPFDFGEWGPSTATLLAAAGNALPALLDMAERCAKAEAELADAMAFAAMWKQRAEASEARGEA